MKDTVKKMKRQAMEMGEIFRNFIYDKGLVYRYAEYVKNSQNNSEKQPKEAIKKKKHKQTCRKMRFYYTSTRMDKFKNTCIRSPGDLAEQ